MSRKRLWKVHSILGLVAGLPLLLIALTGSILVFSEEIEGLINADSVIKYSSESRLGFDQIFQSVTTALPQVEITSWSIASAPNLSDKLGVYEHGIGKWQRLFVNPITGSVQGKPTPSRNYFLGWVLELHYSFFYGHLGMLICGIVALCLIALGVTGIVIYKKFWTNLFTLRWSASRRAFYGDLHRKVGILSSPILLILGITGAYWNLPHSVVELAEHGIDDPETIINRKFFSDSISLDSLVRVAQSKIPSFEAKYLSLPDKPENPIIIYGTVESVNFLRSNYGSRVMFDSATGDIKTLQDIRTASYWTQVEDMFVPLHFGNFGGLAVKVLYCLVGLSPSFLAFTGTYVWWKNRRKKRSQPSSVVASVPIEPERLIGNDGW